jgi:23S rRNA (guanosine2251-2'-O)-methyltransferase
MKEIIVILDNIRSALNVGAIFRTCDGVGVQKLYLVGITPYPPHPKVLKTALGANEYVEYEHVENSIEVIAKYKKEGFEVYSLEENKVARNFFQEDLSHDKLVFVMGNEILGVPEEIQKISDGVLFLPMIGRKNSLNVATTTGIVLYNAQFAR